VRPGTPDNFFRELVARSVSGEIDIRSGSFLDPHFLAATLDGVDTVIHMAASTSGSVAAQVANTVAGSDHLYAASVQTGVDRFVLVSSFGVMDASHLPRGAVLDEQVPLEPHPEHRDPYSFAKLRQEELAWRYRDQGLPLVVIRPGVIFGPGRSALSSRVGLKAPGVFLHLGRGNRIPLTYVENCAEAVVRGALTSDVVGEAFCIVDDDLPTSRHVLRRYRREVAALRFFPIPFPVLRFMAHINAWYSDHTQGHLPPVLTRYKVDAMWKGHRYSNEKAKLRLRWHPRVPMHEALARSLAMDPSRLTTSP
jgi:nucleoside-diphosphate-sugar epimerase